MVKWIKKYWAGYFFLAPWLIGLLAFTIIPMIASLYFSFTKYNLLNTPSFIGFENYIKLFSDKNFLKSLSVTFEFVFLSVPLRMGFALLVAVLLNRKIKGLRYYRAAYYVPTLFGGSVAISILWRQIFNNEGLVNDFLNIFGIESFNWIANPRTALYTLIVLMVWQFGSSMLIFLAALKQVPQELYESADIDGAGNIRKFFSITIPLITPMILFNLVMTVIGAFQAFTPAYIISNGTGGPMGSTLLYSLYLYKRGFNFFQMGYASAMAWLLLIMIGIFTAIIFWTAKKWVYYEG
ncbi:MAG: carbohydrate ABC transporter permease [Halanaerobiaceae bacterium]